MNGGGDALSQWILLVGGFLIAAALLLQRARVVDRSTLPYPALIIVATIGLGLFQLLPIWSTAPDAVRPAIVDLHVEMMSTANQDQTMEFEKAPRMLKSGQADLPSRVPWTIDPHATKQTLAMLFLAGAVFLAAFGFTRTTKQLTQLTLTLGWIGVALTIFAVFVKATWNGKCIG